MDESIHLTEVLAKEQLNNENHLIEDNLTNLINKEQSNNVSLVNAPTHYTEELIKDQSNDIIKDTNTLNQLIDLSLISRNDITNNRFTNSLNMINNIFKSNKKKKIEYNISPEKVLEENNEYNISPKKVFEKNNSLSDNNNDILDLKSNVSINNKFINLSKKNIKNIKNISPEKVLEDNNKSINLSKKNIKNISPKKVLEDNNELINLSKKSNILDPMIYNIPIKNINNLYRHGSRF
jgi:hypothetical protein